MVYNDFKLNELRFDNSNKTVNGID